MKRGMPSFNEEEVLWHPKRQEVREVAQVSLSLVVVTQLHLTRVAPGRVANEQCLADTREAPMPQ